MKLCIYPEGEPPFQTRWYRRLLAAFKALPCHTDVVAEADVIVPAFDVACETNWPYYGEPQRAFVHGSFATYQRQVVPTVAAYLDRFRTRAVLLIDMNPFSPLLKAFGKRRNALFGFASADRRLVRPGIDFGVPAFPLYAGDAAPAGGVRPLLASFIGYNSHPVRARLRALDDGKEIIVRLAERRGYVGCVSIDETAGTSAAVADFDRLARASVFSFVPRGDALFSYRLLEVMRCGSIPVILSDGWLLPFADLIDWSTCAVVAAEADAGGLAATLRAMPAAEIARRQAAVAAAYRTHLAGFEEVARTCAAITARQLAAVLA